MSVGEVASTYLDEVRDAFATWAAVLNVNFREVADSPGNDIRIGMIDGQRGGTLGTTYRWTETGTDRLTRSVIAMDRSEAWTPIHFHNVMLHEIGHALGLAHSKVAGAVMRASYSFRTTSRFRLHQDDVDGVKSIYPTSGPNQDPMPPPGARHVGRFVFLGDLATAYPAPASGALARTGTVVRTAGSFEDERFGFRLSASRTVRIELRKLTADADLYLRGPSGAVVARSVRGATAVDTITGTFGPGLYTIRVNPYAAGAIDYQLRVSVSTSRPPADGRANPATESTGPSQAGGRTRPTAIDLGDLTSLTSPRTLPGTVVRGDGDNEDQYRRFTLTGRRTMRFELRGLSEDADLYLESSSGTVLAQSTLRGTAEDTIVRMLDAGTYYVRVNAFEGNDVTIGYRLRLGTYLPPPADGRTPQTAIGLGDLTEPASPRLLPADTVNRDDNGNDYRRFTLTASRTMRFELRNLNGDANLYLADSSGTMLARSELGGTARDTIVHTLGAGTYYVRVGADDLAAGDVGYRLRIGATPTPPDGRTRQTAIDLGDLTALASPRPLPEDTVNRDDNDDDYRRFTLTARRTMRFELYGLTADADLYLESPAGTVLARSIRLGNADDTIVRTLDAGTYHVRVDAFGSGTIGYRLGLSRQSGPSTPPEGRTRQAAIDLGDLTALASPRTFTDTVDREDGNVQDYRRFTLTARRTMRFELTGLTADADLFLESGTGTTLASSVRTSTLDDTIERTLDAGTYYVRVDAFGSGTIGYRLSFSRAAGDVLVLRAADLAAAPSRRLWRERDAAAGRSPLADGGSRLRETSGILAA